MSSISVCPVCGEPVISVSGNRPFIHHECAKVRIKQLEDENARLRSALWEVHGTASDAAMCTDVSTNDHAEVAKDMMEAGRRRAAADISKEGNE